MSGQQLIQKLWNDCNVLRDDGMSYGDYVEQLTYLLFLKMADEAQPSADQWASEPGQPHPGRLRLARAAGQGWRCAVRPLPPHAGSAGRAAGHAGALIFGKAQNKFQDPGQAAACDR